MKNNIQHFLQNSVSKTYGFWNLQIWIRVKESKFSKNGLKLLSSLNTKIEKEYMYFRSILKGHFYTIRENLTYVFGLYVQQTTKYISTLRATYEHQVQYTHFKILTQKFIWQISVFK